MLAALARIDAEMAKRLGTLAPFLPAVNGEIQRTRAKSHFVSTFGPSDSLTYGNTANVQFSLTLLDFGGRLAQNRSAARLVAAAVANRDFTILSIFNNVVSAYLAVQRGDQLVAVAREAEDNARRSLEYARIQAGNGAFAAYEVGSAEASHVQAHIARVRAQGARANASIELGALIGLNGNEPLKLAPGALDLSKVDALLRAGSRAVEDSIRKSWSSHPAVISALERLAAAQAQQAVVRSAGLPTLSLNGQRYWNGRPQTAPSQAGAREAIVTLSLNIPIFDGFTNLSRSREASAQVAEAMSEVDRVRVGIQLDAWKSFGSAIHQAEIVRENEALVKIARSTMDAGEIRLKSGNIDTVEWLRSQRAYFEARSELVNARAELALSKASLVAVLGLVEPGSVSGLADAWTVKGASARTGRP